MADIEKLKENIKNDGNYVYSIRKLIENNIFPHYRKFNQFDRKHNIIKKYAIYSASNQTLFRKDDVLELLEDKDYIAEFGAVAEAPAIDVGETAIPKNATTTIDDLINKFKEFLVKTYVYGSNS